MKHILFVLALLPVLAFGQSPGLVFKTDRVIPVIATPVWSDEAIVIFHGTPSFDALAGYDTTREQMGFGYQLVLNWKLTPNTTFYGGGAYITLTGDIETVRLSDLWDRLGLAFGVRLLW